MGEILAVQAWDLSLDPGAQLKSCAWQCAHVTPPGVWVGRKGKMLRQPALGSVRKMESD